MLRFPSRRLLLSRRILQQAAPDALLLPAGVNCEASDENDRDGFRHALEGAGTDS